jgi:peptidoglycan/xylan/chitin deacetylase (PgdA/CDA1 family)
MKDELIVDKLQNMKRLIKKVTKDVGLDAFFVRRSDAAIILGLHHVEKDDGSMLSQRVAPINPGMFEGILCYLQSLGYSFVSLNEIVDSPNRSQKVAITFDDGFKSVYVNAFPILQKFQAPFTVFLTTATLGANNLLWLHRIYAAVDRLTREDVHRSMERCSLKIQPDLSLSEALGVLVCQESPDRLLLFADELASKARLTASDETNIAERLYLKPHEVMEMMQGGMTIGAHGHNHWSMETMDQALTEIEIVKCKEMIEETFGVQVAHYAPPYGRSNPQVRLVLEQHDFKSLCTADPGLVRTNTNFYALPRLMVGTNTDVMLDLAGEIILLHLQQCFIASN